MRVLVLGYVVSMSEPQSTMIYDGDCGFCLKWIRRWSRITGPQVDYIPYQGLSGRFSEIPRANLEQAVHLVEPSGRVSQGAEAVFRTLAMNSRYDWAFGLYARFRAVRLGAELGYRWVARNRALIPRLTRWL